MADLTREELHRLARLGAKARLEELRKEEAAIRRAFPDLFGGGRQPPAGGGAARRKRKPMTDAQKQIVSERMKKYWAAKRKTKK